MGYFNEDILGTDSLPIASDPLFVIGNGDLFNRSNALTLLKNGNLGLGTSTPDTTLHVVGQFRYEDGNEQAGYVLTSDANGVASWQSISGGDNLGDHTATQPIQLGTNFLSGDGDNEGVYVAANGNVGINTNNPQHMLQLGGTAGRKLALFQDVTGEDFYGFGVGVNLLEFYAGATSTDDPDMVINRLTGNVGIGTTTPTRARLEIAGGPTLDLPIVGFLPPSGVTGAGDPPSTYQYSLYADQRIAALEVFAHSDRRIKTIQGISDGNEDLSTLMQIEVTDYRLRDSIAKGTHEIKKVIAQQVAEVYPQAVNTDLTEVVPDIYQRAEVQNGWIMLATDLEVGERVKLITEEGAKVYGVSKVEADRFQVSGLLVSPPASRSKAVPPLFVYGREVDDFHTVDYEAISMLNVSATQEQQRRIEALEAENEALKEQNEAQQAEIDALQTQAEQMEELEARLYTLESLLLSSPSHSHQSR